MKNIVTNTPSVEESLNEISLKNKRIFTYTHKIKVNNKGPHKSQFLRSASGAAVHLGNITCPTLYSIRLISLFLFLI